MRKLICVVAVGLFASSLALAQAPAKTADKAAAKSDAKADAKAPAGKTELTWWGHATWIVKTPGGATIVIDPWLTNPKAPKDAKPPEQVDAILVTHGHFDHSGDAASLAKKTGAQVIGAYELVGLIGAEHSNGMNIGGTVKVKDATISLVMAVHSSGYGQDPKNPQYGGPALGYIVKIDNGPTLYHAGDTDVFDEMSLIAERYHPTVAMLPIGGHFTMDPQGAALAAKLLKVKTVYPMHYGTFPVLTGTPDELKAAAKKTAPGVTITEATPGTPITL
ncbi:MAG: metal-dependent hydrolase [Myxococcaceae bacterium]